MKAFFFLLVFSLLFYTALPQNISINTDGSSGDASAMLDIKSNIKGLLIPRTSTATRLSINSPAKGLLLYDTTTASFW